MAENKDVRIKITGDSSDFKRELDKVSRDADNAAARVGRTTQAIGKIDTKAIRGAVSELNNYIKGLGNLVIKTTIKPKIKKGAFGAEMRALMAGLVKDMTVGITVIPKIDRAFFRANLQWEIDRIMAGGQDIEIIPKLNKKIIKDSLRKAIKEAVEGKDYKAEAKVKVKLDKEDLKKQLKTTVGNYASTVKQTIKLKDEAGKEEERRIREEDRIKRNLLKDEDRARREQERMVKQEEKVRKELARNEERQLKEKERLTRQIMNEKIAELKEEERAYNRMMKEQNKSIKEAEKANKIETKRMTDAAKSMAKVAGDNSMKIRKAFSDVGVGLKRDFSPIISSIKDVINPQTLTMLGAIATSLALVTAKETISLSNKIEATGVTATSRSSLTPEETQTFNRLIEKLSEKKGVGQTEIFTAAQEIFSAGIKGTPKEISDMTSVGVDLNIAGGRMEELSSSIGYLTSFVKGSGKELNKDNYQYASDFLTNLANVSGGKDYLVKQYFSQSIPLTKVAGIKDNEAGAVYSGLVGSTGDEAEAATQLQTFSKELIKITPESEQAFKDLGFSATPQKIIEKTGLFGFFEQLKEKLQKSIPDDKLKDIENVKKQLADANKQSTERSYRVSTETIDPATGDYVKIETEESIRRRNKLTEKKIELQNKLNELAENTAKYDKDNFLTNLSKIFPNVNAFLPMIYTLNDGMDNYATISKDLSDVVGETKKITDLQVATTAHQYDIETVKFENFKKAIGDAIKPEVLQAFRDLNDWFGKNKESIVKLAREGVEFAVDKIKKMYDWVVTNKEEIKKFWETSKEVLSKLGDAFKVMWDVVGDILGKMKDMYEIIIPEGLKKMIEEHDAGLIALGISVLAFRGTILGGIGLLGKAATAVATASATATTATATLAGGAATAAGSVSGITIALAGLTSALAIFAAGGVAWGAIEFFKELNETKKNLDMLDGTYLNLGHEQKTDIQGITNRLKAIDEQINVIEGGDLNKPMGVFGRNIKIKSKEEQAVIDKLMEEKMTLTNMLAQRGNVNQKKKEVKSTKEFNDYVSDELAGNNDIRQYINRVIGKDSKQVSSTIINQTIQGTVVTQNQVNSATNKATQKYNIKNGLNAQK